LGGVPRGVEVVGGRRHAKRIFSIGGKGSELLISLHSLIEECWSIQALVALTLEALPAIARNLAMDI
jgi:hypothetical protein